MSKLIELVFAEFKFRKLKLQVSLPWLQTGKAQSNVYPNPNDWVVKFFKERMASEFSKKKSSLVDRAHSKRPWELIDNELIGFQSFSGNLIMAEVSFLRPMNEATNVALLPEGVCSKGS